jgi:predicted subunit of tRNA(5-methylaminomethyl-2-thiouridylate) methyltransferase
MQALLGQARAQGAPLDEGCTILREAVAMLLEDGEPRLAAKFISTRTVVV